MGLIGSVFAVASRRRPAARRLLRRDALLALGLLRQPADRRAAPCSSSSSACTCTCPRSATQIDYLGAALLTAGVSALILVTTWGGNEYAWGSPTIVGARRRRRRAARASSSCRSAAPPEPIIPLKLFRSRGLQRRVLARLRDRPGDVRRDHLHPAVPAARLRRQPDELRPADAAADGRPADREHPLRPRDQPDRPLQGRSRSPAPRSRRVGLFLLSRLEVDTPPWVASVYMLVRRRRHRPRDAGARARRPERRAAARHRRRHLHRDVLPLAWAARSASRCSARSSPRAWPTSSRRCPAAAAAQLQRRRQHQPGRRSTRCPPASATTSWSRSSTRCSRSSSSARRSPLVAFVLAWLLKEVPLRATNHAPPDQVTDPGLELEYEEPVSRS